jgi:galactokinase
MSGDGPGTRPVERSFDEHFGERPEATATAPGRVNLIGGHVDYNDGVVLPVAIDRWTVVGVRPRDDDVVRVHSLALEETRECTIGDSPEDWAAYVVGTATVLAEETDEPLGADLLVGGNMVMGAGLSSSAALEVAVGGALCAVHDLDLDREALATACWRAENEEVGMACGIMDQFASAMSRSGYALRLDCRTRSVRHVPFDAETARLLVVDTNVTHELTSSGFNDRVYECHETTAQLDAVVGKRVRSLRDVTPEELQAYADELDSPHYRRARHVTSEIRRVEAAAEALSAGHLQSVGSLMRESHRSLREDYEVSCDELDVVVDVMDEQEGVFGARMVGGGWGGSVVALVEPDAVDDVAATTSDRYQAETDVECDTYAFTVGDGLCVETSGREPDNRLVTGSGGSGR